MKVHARAPHHIYKPLGGSLKPTRGFQRESYEKSFSSTARDMKIRPGKKRYYQKLERQAEKLVLCCHNNVNPLKISQTRRKCLRGNFVNEMIQQIILKLNVLVFVGGIRFYLKRLRICEIPQSEKVASYTH